MSIWLVGLVGAVGAQEPPADLQDVCTEAGFAPGVSPALSAFLAAREGRESLDGAGESQRYESCLMEMAGLSSRQARCEVLYGRRCETPKEWGEVDASLADQDESLPELDRPAWQTKSLEETAPTGSSAEGSALPWVWTPGVETASEAPGPPAPGGRQEEDAGELTGWSVAGTQGAETEYDPHAWWLAPEVQDAWSVVIQAKPDTRWQERTVLELALVLQPYDKDVAQLTHREEGWACAQAALPENGEAEEDPDRGLTSRLAAETRAAWAEAVAVSQRASDEDRSVAGVCLGHKLFLLQSYTERTSTLYDDSIVAIEACDAVALDETLRQLHLAARRAEDLSREVQACLEPFVLGEGATVVSVESGMTEDEDFLDIDGPLASVGDDLGANPVSPDPVSPYE